QLQPPPVTEKNWPANADNAKPTEKTYDFNMSKKPWKDVLPWLADKTGTPYINTFTPAGTFNYLAPKGKTKFTLPEIIDLLNEALAKQKYLLVRRSTYFTIIGIDKKSKRSPNVRSAEAVAGG